MTEEQVVEAPEEEVQEEAQEVAGDGPSIEERAAARGHKPLEEWEGSPEDWVGPEEFLKMAEERKGAYHAQLRAMEKRMDEMRKAQERQEKFFKQNIEMAKQQAEEKVRQAFQNGDEQEFNAALAERDKLNAPEPEEPSVDPAVQDFIERNSWYENDAILAATANGLSAHIRQEMPHLSVAQNLAEVERRMAERNLLSQQKQTPRPTPVAQARKRAPVKRTGFESLDDDHKQNFSDLVRQGLFKDDDEGRTKYYSSVSKYEERRAR